MTTRRTSLTGESFFYCNYCCSQEQSLRFLHQSSSELLRDTIFLKKVSQCMSERPPSLREILALKAAQNSDELAAKEEATKSEASDQVVPTVGEKPMVNLLQVHLS